MGQDRSQMQWIDELTDSTPRFPKCLVTRNALTNKHASTPEETIGHFPVAHIVRGQFALPNPVGTGKNGLKHYCHLSCHTGEIQRQDHPKWTLIGQLASTWRWFVVLLIFVGRIYFALATTSCWYFPHDTDVKDECPCTQVWVSHGVSCLWNHISAWNVTFLGLAHFDVHRWAVVSSFCLWIFGMLITVDCAPVTLWICCHGGYWGMYTNCAFETHRLKFF